MAQTKSAPAAKAVNNLKALSALGQSVWLDYIRRDLLTTGALARLIDEDGLSGLTSNPSIFEKAIADSPDYAPKLRELKAKPGLSAMDIYEAVAMDDIRAAADALRPVYDKTKRRDGYVSMEVSPYLARDTRSTLAEARRLWKAVGRENLMIKVPGTPEGIPAIETLISEGINVNVTLLFSRDLYAKAAWAYVAGLEQRAASGQSVSGIAGVASFFVSRIDTAADARLAEAAKAGGERAKTAESLLGKVAIANAKLAYALYKDIIADQRWRALEAKGAMTQRLLWASTSTKNPKYRDVLYIEDLIGKDTVNTVPPATLDAFRDHGRAAATLEQGLSEAKAQLAALESLGISLNAITDEVLFHGVKLFADAFDKLLAAVGRPS
ncbi:MAG TPA: transaldolase [Elusimicrobiota bacterium]|nr:transaldolase [Elusimicrobiota bacterium]